MATFAAMLKERGYRVTGSDQGVYPPMSDFLARAGIEVMQGYRAENLTPAPDLVIVGNAVSRTNPEVAALLESHIPYQSFPQALGDLFLEGKLNLTRHILSHLDHPIHVRHGYDGLTEYL